MNIYILLSTAKGKAEQNQHRGDADLSNDLSLIFFSDTMCGSSVKASW